jgi:hypothetical protein
MPKVSIYRQKRIMIKKEQAYYLHKQGHVLRDIGNILGMSHEWVRTAIDEMTILDNKPEEEYTGITSPGSDGTR